MQLFLIRHAETDWSRSGRHTGLTDLPLTEEGRRQAERLGNKLRAIPFHKVWVSSLLRARQTCQLLGLESQAEVDSDLVEWNYGLYEGKTFGEITAQHPGWNLFVDGAPGGESPEAVQHRVLRVQKRVCAQVPQDATVALISSAHFLRAFAALWMQLPLVVGRHLLLSTASLSILGFERDHPALIRWNDPLLP